VAVYAFTPALLVHRVGSALTAARLWQWWPLPVVAVGWVGCGCVLGLLLARALRLRLPVHRRLLMAFLAFKNNQSIPLALVPALAAAVPTLRLSDDPTDDAAAAAARAASYVLFYTSLTSLLRWTIGAYLLRGPAPRVDADGTDTSSSSSNGGDGENRGSASVPLAPVLHTPRGGAEAGAARPRPEEKEDDVLRERVRGGGEEEDETEAEAPADVRLLSSSNSTNTYRGRWRRLWATWRPRLAQGWACLQTTTAAAAAAAAI
jgi:hypothetical protein